MLNYLREVTKSYTKKSDIKRSHGVSAIHATLCALIYLSSFEGSNVLGLHATLLVNSWLHNR